MRTGPPANSRIGLWTRRGKPRAESVCEGRAERRRKSRAEDRRQVRADLRLGHSQKSVTSRRRRAWPRQNRRSWLCRRALSTSENLRCSQGVCTCDSAKCGSCQTDCRHDTIFGTETIFGDVSLGLFRDQHPCPYECTGAGRPKSLVQVFSKLDASLQKVFVCRRGTCGSANCKGTGDCQCKANGKGDMGTAPILEGQPEEPEQEGNPFHDDAVEPAPLPPMPQMTSAASDASQIRLSRPPAKLGAVRAKPVSSHSAPPTRQADPLTTGEPTPSTKSATAAVDLDPTRLTMPTDACRRSVILSPHATRVRMHASTCFRRTPAPIP